MGDLNFNELCSLFNVSFVVEDVDLKPLLEVFVQGNQS